MQTTVELVGPAAVSFLDSLPHTLARTGIPPAGWDVLSLEEFKCLLNYTWCRAADGTTALAREYREMPEAPPFAFVRVQAEKSMIAFFGTQCSDASAAVFAARAPQNTWFSCPFDPECCYLFVDGSCEPAAEDSPEKVWLGLHAVRANIVHWQFCSPIFCGNVAELVALVHALEFVLSQPPSLNFMMCFDSMYAAHVVQQSWQANSHLEVVRYAGELH